MQLCPDGAAVEMNSAARRGGRSSVLGYGRLVWWLVSSALFIVFASYVALPLGLAWYVPQLAARYGIRLDVEGVRVEPFRSRLRFIGVRIATAADSTMEWTNIETRVDLAELLSRRLVLDDLRLSGAKLHAGGPGSGTDALPAATPAVLREGVNVGELVIDDVELTTISAKLGRPVTIDWLRIVSLDHVFRPKGAEFEADISIDEGHARLHGRLGLDVTGWTLDAEVAASDVALDGFPALLGASGSWHGSIAASGPVRFVYSPVDGAFSATTGARWTIDGLEFQRADAVVTSARIDWNGAVFMASSGDAVETLSVDGEARVRNLEAGIADALQVDAAETALRVDASQAPAPHLSVVGRSPSVRVACGGAASEAIDAQATNLVMQVTLTLGDDLGVEIDRLDADALTATLPAGRSIDVDRIGLERVVVGPNVNVISAAVAERMSWRGFTAPHGTGTATRLAMQRLERHEGSGLRLASASAETFEARNDEFDLQLREVTLDSTTLSPAGAIVVDGARVADAWLAGETNTLILERLALEGIERDASGTMRIAEGQAHLVDHTLVGRQSTVSSGFELASATISDRTWGAEHILLGEVEVETGTASYALRRLTLVDATGDGEQASARFARVGALEHGFGASRIVGEDLYAISPTWRGGVGNAQAIEAASLTLDTADRHRWQAGGSRLTGVEMTVSDGASAEAASLESLVLNAADSSTIGAQRIELMESTFDGESTVQAANASAEHAHYHASDGTGVDITGLRGAVLAWNGDVLAVERGSAPLMSVVTTPFRASFDITEFTSVRLGASGLRRIGTLTSASGRGETETTLGWSMGGLELNGYHASAAGETVIDFGNMLDVEVRDESGEAHLHADRLSAREARFGPSSTVDFAMVEADGVALRDAGGRVGTSAHALQASPITIRESAIEIGSLVLSGLEATIGLTGQGAWELPALPIGTVDPHTSFGLRIDEIGTAGSSSALHFIDRTTDPDFTARIGLANATLRGLDSEAIGLPARFAVEATAANVLTTLKADGALTPTLTSTDLDLNAMIHGLSLPELSPYSRLHLGHELAGGSADVALDLTIRTSDLEGTADFVLNEVVFGEQGSPAGSGSGDSAPLAGALAPGSSGPTSLGTALVSLADEQGRIELGIPLRGELDAPDFDFDGLLIRSLADAVFENAAALPTAE